MNTACNQNYIGPYPDIEYYNPDGMMPDARQKFLEWYNEVKNRGDVFDMAKEITKYCRSDVDILRRGCIQFQQLFKTTTGVDPFAACITIASACNLVFRRNFLKPDTIAIFPQKRHIETQSVIALKWLSYVSQENNIRIQHAKNGGEFRIGSFRVDGYSRDTNTIYEFHGKDTIEVNLSLTFEYNNIIKLIQTKHLGSFFQTQVVCFMDVRAVILAPL